MHEHECPFVAVIDLFIQWFSDTFPFDLFSSFSQVIVPQFVAVGNKSKDLDQNQRSSKTALQIYQQKYVLNVKTFYVILPSRQFFQSPLIDHIERCFGSILFEFDVTHPTLD